MKKLITLLVFALAANVTFAQDLIAKTYVEHTHMTPKVGTAIGFQTDYGWEYGGFYQKATPTINNGETTNQPKMYEEEFFGIFGNAVIAETNKLDILLNARIGVTNRENFAITPAVLANFKTEGKVKFGGGIGVRALRPTYQATITFDL